MRGKPRVAVAIMKTPGVAVAGNDAYVLARTPTRCPHGDMSASHGVIR